MCEITRNKVCVGDYYVGRIIARPFIGKPGHFVRTSNRHDYSRMPEHRMVQQELQVAQIPTVAVGKLVISMLMSDGMKAIQRNRMLTA